jgi:hypothetical protein
MTISHREYHDVSRRQRSGFNSRFPTPKLQVPERHKRKCIICKHPDREKIDAAFLDWQRPTAIAAAFGLSDPRSLYRHTHATGLYELRRLKFSCAVDMVIESIKSHHNYNALLRAVCVAGHMDVSGKRNPPSPRVVIISDDPLAAGCDPVQRVEVEPDLAVELTKAGVRLPANRQLLVRFENSRNG